jgi:sugar phosphate isomerase/epimerase
MNYALMTYTFARQTPGGKPDMVKLCRLARELGLDAMDQVHLYGYEPAEIRRIADDHGIRIVCYTFSVDLNFPDAAGRQPGLDALKAGIDVACTLGAPIIMLPICGKQGQTREQSRRNVLAGLREGVKFGQAAGVKVSVEHFPQAISPFIVSDDIEEALKTVPDLWVTFDSGNMVTGGEDPSYAFLRHKQRIAHAHFKDWSHPAEGGMVGLDGKRYKGALIGEGIIDYKALVRTMAKAGYRGYIDIEYEGNDYTPEDATRRALDYLRSIETQMR